MAIRRGLRRLVCPSLPIRSGGVYLAPSAYEAGFLSSAHGDAEINHTLEAAREALREVAAG